LKRTDEILMQARYESHIEKRGELWAFITPENEILLPYREARKARKDWIQKRIKEQ